MLPKDWKKSTVGAECSIKNNLRFPINTIQRQTMKGIYPYFGPTGVIGYIDHYRIDEEFAVIGEDGYHFLKFRDKPMTLHFQGKANVNNHAHIIGESESCSTKWFYYWFMNRDLSAALSRQGVGRYKLTKKSLEDLEIWIPPKKEQLDIVRILSTWEKSIELKERLLINSRKKMKTLLHKMLIKPALKGKWPMMSISEISDRVQRRIDSDEVLPILMISSGSGFVRQDKKYSRFMAGKSLDNYINLRKGEFAYNKGNSKRYEYGCIYPLNSQEQGLVPHVYVCFRLNEYCISGFFENLFSADFLHDQLGALVNTGVRNNGLLNIKSQDFLACKVPVPSIDEQMRIAETLSVSIKWIEIQEKAIENLKQEKKALMTMLLTGKRRVNLSNIKTETDA